MLVREGTECSAGLCMQLGELGVLKAQLALLRLVQPADALYALRLDGVGFGWAWYGMVWAWCGVVWGWVV